MINCHRFSYAAPPRTGTAWFHHCLVMAELTTETRDKVHQIPPADPRFNVTVVRHPADWLISYYESLRGGLIGIPQVDRFAQLVTDAVDEKDFAVMVADRMPGAVGEMFAAYRTDTVLRLEDMPWAAVELFKMFGVDATGLMCVRSAPPINARKKPIYYSEGIRQMVIKAEAEFCERYEYFQ